MRETLKKILDPIKNFWGGLTMRIRIILIATIVAVLVVALVLALILNKSEYVTIYDELSASEVSEILAAINDMDVKVKVEGGDAILVPSDREAEVRMALATAGYPKSGLSYYLIQDNSNMLTTDYERKQYETMQLQERLGATIETLEGVKQAIVTIAQAEESIFYLTEKTEASASVTVHMKKGYELDETQVGGIRNLVSSAVAGLQPSNVSITDGQGNELLDDGTTGTDSKRTKLAYEVENAIKKKVESIVNKIYGQEHAKVAVTANINTDNRVEETMTYYPSDPLGNGNNTGVTYEETHATDNYQSTGTDGGVPATSTNADVVTYPTTDGENMTSSQSTSDQIKYDVSYVKTLLEKNGAYIEGLSVSVVIDKPSFDPGERENLTETVAYAAGVPEDSVTVQSFKFFTEEGEEPIIEEGGLGNLLYIIIGAALLLIIALVVLLLIMRRKKKALEEAAIAEAEEMERQRLMQEALGEAGEGGEGLEKDILPPIQRIEDEVIAEIRQFTMENPEVAAQMVKTWLRSEDEF